MQSTITRTLENLANHLANLADIWAWVGHGARKESSRDKNAAQVLYILDTWPCEMPKVSAKNLTSKPFLVLTWFSTYSSHE